MKDNLLSASFSQGRRKREGERGGREEAAGRIVSFVELPRTEENAQAERVNDEIGSSGARIVQLHCMQYLYHKTSNMVMSCREK